MAKKPLYTDEHAHAGLDAKFPEIECFPNQYKEDYIRKLVGEYNIDGVIFHDAKTCPNNSNSQYNLPSRLRKEGIPAVVINGDLCDLRCYSDEQSTTVIEAFVETL